MQKSKECGVVKTFFKGNKIVFQREFFILSWVKCNRNNLYSITQPLKNEIPCPGSNITIFNHATSKKPCFLHCWSENNLFDWENVNFPTFCKKYIRIVNAAALVVLLQVLKHYSTWAGQVLWPYFFLLMLQKLNKAISRPAW